MSLTTEVQNLTAATSGLLNAVQDSKAQLDSAVVAAEAARDEAVAETETAIKLTAGGIRVGGQALTATQRGLLVDGASGAPAADFSALVASAAAGASVELAGRSYVATSTIVLADGGSLIGPGSISFSSFYTIDVGNNCRVDGLSISGGANAITINGKSGSKIANNVISDAAYFGVYVAGGSHDNEFVGNSCESNGLELIGVTHDCHSNLIKDNRAKGTGDNGISVTGYRNIVIGNDCQLNANHGIGVYGERNTVVGNKCKNNGQRNLETPGVAYAGITATPSFGGLSRKNTITGNICDDDQEQPTQHHGVKLGVNAYVTWASGQTVENANLWRSNGLNIYKASGPGTTGATAPTHTTGSVSDGGVTWQYIRSNASGPAAEYEPWVTGEAVLSGVFRVNSSYLYVSTGAGTTGATAPTHTSGTVSDGTVSWAFVEQIPANFDAWDNTVVANACSGNLVSPLGVLSANANNCISDGFYRLKPDNRNFSVDVLATTGTPEGVLTAQPGSIAMRYQTSAPGLSIYTKQSGSGNTGWLPVLSRHSGTTAQRPNFSAVATALRGYEYFDTTIGKPIWWSGAAWVDSAGTAV